VIALEQLIASALGEVDGDEADRIDEHVLSCGVCAEVYAILVRLGPALAALVRSGETMMPVTRSLVDRLAEAGLITRRYALAPGSVTPCAVGASDVYTLTTYEVDLTGVGRLDLERQGQRHADLPFDADAGRLYMLSRADQLRALPSLTIHLRLIDVKSDGTERVLGMFTLEHTGFAAG